MRRTIKAAICLLSLVGAASTDLSAQAQQGTNLLIGKWKFNPQKSKMGLSLPPRDLTRTYEDAGNGVYIFMQTGHLADGTKTESLYVARDDGREFPLMVLGADMLPAAFISLKRIDAYTAEQTQRINAPLGEFGQGAPQAAVRKISPDGKTMTLTISAPRRDAKVDPMFELEIAGSNEVDVMVFDKQ